MVSFFYDINIVNMPQTKNLLVFSSFLILIKVFLLALLVSFMITTLCFLIVERPEGSSFNQYLMMWIWMVLALAPYYMILWVLLEVVVYNWNPNGTILFVIVSLLFFIVYIFVFDAEWEFILVNQLVVTCAFLYCVKEVKKLKQAT